MARGQEFYDTLQSFHFMEEKHELLVVGLEFPILGMVKIEPDHRSLV